MTAIPVSRSIPAWQKSALVFLALAAIGAVLMFPAASHAAAKAKAVSADKVVFQVSDGDPKKWNLALNNINNVQEALGKGKVKVELVAYGPGIGMLRMESEVGNRVNDAVASGVKIVACETTMRALKLTKKDMLDSIGYVPGGVIELMKREHEGYAYIRP
ncbi:DsrE/DsrF-like family protein [mine drainage metagenome]|uniref:DsrE/DsrF-like family protein n=1 Tax=mine drainage metagenome TaxID=410659 RepID=A0A1J5S3B0_9ZZZZ